MNFIKIDTEKLDKVIEKALSDGNRKDNLMFKMDGRTFELLKGLHLTELRWHSYCHGGVCSIESETHYKGIFIRLDNTLEYGEIKLIREYL